MPPSLREWLPEEHFAWFVLDAVGEMDLAAFYAAYRDDGRGRAAHDPAMMVALLLYAYAIGERSSRAIERALPRGRRVPGDHRQPAPDHATIARFRVAPRSGDRRAVRRGAGAVRAQPGWSRSAWSRSTARRSRANATQHATRDYEQIAREILEEAARDRRGRGRAVRRGARRRAARGAARRAGIGARWLREAKQALEAERAARGREDPARPRPSGSRVPAPARQDWSSSATSSPSTTRGYAAGIASDGSRRMAGARHNIKPYPLPAAGGQDQRDRPRLAQPQDDARVGAGLQRPGRRRRAARSCSPPRSAPSRWTPPACEPMIERRRSASSRAPASPTRPGSCWPTPATGRATRSTRSSAAGHPDPGRARRRPPQRHRGRAARRPL